MTDNTQSPLPEPQPEITPLAPESLSQPPKKSNKKLWLIIGIVFSVFCIGATLCGAIFGSALYKVGKEKAPVESVLDTFMKAMDAKDAKSAYALFSPRAQRQIQISNIQNMIEGNNYVLFEEYKSLSVEEIRINATVNADQDTPQGTVAEVSGIITYAGDIQGTFTGVLEKVNGEWKLHGMNVVVPPNKFP